MDEREEERRKRERVEERAKGRKVRQELVPGSTRKGEWTSEMARREGTQWPTMPEGDEESTGRSRPGGTRGRASWGWRGLMA